MTSTAQGSELKCAFGDVPTRLLQRIYNLRITYPSLDIIIHASDVKSCFRQLKHHPDVMGAFAYIIHDILFLQCGLSFGSDFSPANWEVVRQVTEIIAEALFSDDTLRKKHRKHLDRLRWQHSLGSPKAKFTPAKADSINPGVRDSHSNDVNTPHHMFVDDDTYAEVFSVERVEQAIAASIEAMFILLGESDIFARQDCISWDKLEEMTIDWLNKILGMQINTRTLAVRVPMEYVQGTINLLESHWHKKRKRFKLSEIETLAGQLGHIASTSPWLRYLMSHVYTSIAAALGVSRAWLISNSKDFRDMMKLIKAGLAVRSPDLSPSLGENSPHTDTNTAAVVEARPNSTDTTPELAGTSRAPPADTTSPPGANSTARTTEHSPDSGDPSDSNEATTESRHVSYAQSQTARQVHKSQKRYRINHTLRRELRLIYRALTSDWIDMWDPIGHKIPRDPTGKAWSDSCLRAAGGYSYHMKFWWYIEWPEHIQKSTLIYVTNDSEGKLISINVLEYAALIINYVACYHFLVFREPDPTNPHPVVLLYADNTTAESWFVKACKRSFIGRALGRIQGALMINNPVGINVAHVTSKDNEIADGISRIKREADTVFGMDSLFKDHPKLKSCPRFHPSAELVSLILDTLSKDQFVDPLQVSRRVLACPGKITS